MNNFVELLNVPELENSRVARAGRKLILAGFGLKALHGVVAIALMMVFGVASASAQTPNGSFFNGTSSQLGNSFRSVTFFLAAAMIIAGINFIAIGIITSGLRESLSTWKFITGAGCFAFGGVCAAIYAFSQGSTVPLGVCRKKPQSGKMFIEPRQEIICLAPLGAKCSFFRP